MKIKKTFMESGGARYIPKLNIIYYDEELDKFPMLKKELLDHEKKHSLKPFNYFHHILLDAKDYPRLLLSKKYYDYTKHKEDLFNPKKFRSYLGIILYDFFNAIFQIILIFPRTISSIIYKMKEK